MTSTPALNDTPRVVPITAPQEHIAAPNAAFPLPDEINESVAFWINVFGRWDLPEVVFHDERHLGILYNKVILDKDGDGERYGDKNHDFLEAHKTALEADLTALESAVRRDAPLSDNLQTLYDVIVAAEGESAIYGAADRIRYQRGQKRRYARGLANEAKYLPLFKAIFEANDVPSIIAYLPHVESSFRNHLTSKANAYGMWQFTQGASDIFMLDDPALDERADPVASARGAARYQAGAYGYLQSWPLAVTSYNHGIGGMRRANRAYGDDFGAIYDQYDGPLFGFASRNFYPELLAVAHLSENRDQYFAEWPTNEPLDLSAIVLKQPAYLQNIVDTVDYDKNTLIELNPSIERFAWEDPLTLLPKGSIFWLPADGADRYSEIAISALDTERLAQTIVQALPAPNL